MFVRKVYGNGDSNVDDVTGLTQSHWHAVRHAIDRYEFYTTYVMSRRSHIVTLGWHVCDDDVQGGPQQTGTLCFVRLNFIKYWPIFKLISLSE